MHKVMIYTGMLVLILLIPDPSFAVQPESNESIEDVKLIIRPHICIAPRGQTSCISRIEVLWESPSLLDVCLYSSLAQEQLQCWEQAQSGNYEHKVTIISDLEYWLTPFDQQLKLAHSLVKFVALKPHRKYNRRRNHLPWSIQSL